MSFELSDHDRKIITTILGAGGDPTTCYKVDLALPPDQHYSLETVESLVKVERTAIKLCDASNYSGALALLDGLIEEYPLYASAYNNRAQIIRGQSATDARATNDLLRVLELAKPAGRVISKMQANVLRSANGQLAAINMQRAKESDNEQLIWDLKEDASRRLAVAGALGDEIMAILSTHVNPFAQLCGNMVEQILGAEQARNWSTLRGMKAPHA